jgi:murein DD-endopeptidase MepM/ murein hydrolase activator NlpD
MNPAESVLGTAGVLAQDALLMLARFFLWLSSVASAAGRGCADAFTALYYGFRRRAACFRVNRINCALIMGVFVTVIFSSSLYGLGLEVYLNGRSVGFVHSRQEMESTITGAEERVSEIIGTPYQMTPKISYRFGFFDRSKMANLDVVENSLFQGIKGVEKLFVLTVDGEVVCASRDRATLDSALSTLLAKYPEEDASDKSEFLKDVKITQKYTSTKYLMSDDQIKEKLGSNIRDQKAYTVQKGDTVSGIAAENGMSTEDLVSLNPGLSEKTIKAGSDVVVKGTLPFLSVQLTKKVSYAETIPFESTTVEDKSLYKGQKKVKVEGKNGEAQITASVVYVDGREQSREILNRVVVSEPVTKVTLAGTKAIPPKSPTGTFMRPFRGIVTSNYGYRGREFHTGVDFAGPYGSTIVASDGGKVVFSGRKGTYGYCVIISHGNGLETLYGHCSKLLVKVGQKVAKGEAIARLGSTGRSTGPHVHFEVRRNGHHVSPWKYIK